jgi:peptidoglycan/LPS O-acetylase OafA/YrhL
MISPHSRIVKSSLGDAFVSQRIAFGFLRFTLAMSVIFSHSYAVGGFGRDPLEAIGGPRLTLGLLAVALFFVLSGYLITRSALHSPSMARFLWHRFLRIFPGYWMCLAICAFIIAPFVFEVEHGHALRIFSTGKISPQAFLAGNVALFHFNGFSISGVMNIQPWSIGLIMSHNPSRWIVNGSLWSLPYEWMCYLAVALLASFQILRRRRGIVLIVFVTFWSLYALDWVAPRLFHDCFPSRGMGVLVMLCSYFSAGSVCYLYRYQIPFSFALMSIALILLAVGLLIGWFGIIAPIALPYLFLWVACRLPIRHFDAGGDYSYGLYIYAFPVQQTLASLHINTAGFAAYLALTIALSLAFAFFSYHFIEAPCLRFKSVDPRWLIAKFRMKRQTAALIPPMAIASKTSASQM